MLDSLQLYSTLILVFIKNAWITEFMDHANGYLSKMMPGFQNLPEVEDPTATDPNEIEDDEFEDHDLAAESYVPPAQEERLSNGPEMLTEVASSLRRYLVCDDHQLTHFGDASTYSARASGILRYIGRALGNTLG